MRKKTKNYFNSLCFCLTIILCFANDLSQAQNLGTPPQALPHSTTLQSPRSPLPNSWQGQQIYLNQQKLSIPWIQWQEGTEWRTGISDLAAMQILGLELLDTDNPNLQPVSWFSQSSSQPMVLKAKHLGAYRYLDISELMQQTGWRAQAVGDTLVVNAPSAKIKSISHQRESWGEKIIVNLDRPTFWQTIQNNKQGTITLEAIAEASELDRFKELQSSLLPTIIDEGNKQNLSPKSLDRPTNKIFLDEEQAEEEGAVTPTLNPPPQLSAPNIQSLGNSTKFSFDFSGGQRLRIATLTNPYRLAIEVRPDAFVERNLLWYPGIRWHQQYVQITPSANTLPSLFPEDASRRNQFPVTWLEIDPRSPKLSLKPITSYADSMVGTAPLLTTARWQEAIVAINGGFFNRNNKMPLGAVRSDNLWLSGPILNRAAIAWNEKGNIKIDRLSLIEKISTSSGENVPIQFLNSGYIQAGVSRYTKEWGTSYTPLTNQETIMLVQNDRVTKHLLGAEAGSDSFPIPRDGYLLTIRGNQAPRELVQVGTTVKLTSTTTPSEFSHYPHILGAGPLLLQNRQIVLNAIAEKFSPAFNKQSASRSALGVSDRGKLIVAVVRSRIGGIGPNLSELAQIMQRLGAVDAINLDGGSSTSLVLGGQLVDRSPSEAARVHNGIGIFIKR